MFVQGDLAWMQNFRKTVLSAWYATETAPDTHILRNPNFKSLSHLVLEHFALLLVSKFTHLGNKDFPPVFFESLCLSFCWRISCL